MTTNPGDNLGSLDLGSTAQFVQTWLGPSLGWQILPVDAQQFITSPDPLVLGAYANRVILKAAVKAIALPSVSEWVLGSPPVGQNVAGWTRSLWIKDLVGAASVAAPVVVTANGSDTVDGFPSYSIITPYDLLRPLTDLSGWWVG